MIDIIKVTMHSFQGGITMDYTIWTLVYPVLLIMGLMSFFAYYYRISHPIAGTLEWITFSDKPKFTFAGKRHRLTRKDALPVLIVTILYACVAFLGLGNNSAPQTFYRFKNNYARVMITLDTPQEIGTIMYYSGLHTGYYRLEFSNDLVRWEEQKSVVDEEDPDSTEFSMYQTHGSLFKWQYASLNEEQKPIQYISISCTRAPLELGEIAIFNADGEIISADSMTFNVEGADVLVDEQDVVPEYPTYMNGTYFDEIYHPRTAYEHILHENEYEISHPPLGKLIISIGIRIFGMTPWGWRFMGTLFGVLMLPIIYVFMKQMFGKTVVATCGTILFAFDAMHFVQTRLATIDTYSVFFILLMYLFMFRFVTRPKGAPLKTGIIDLFLSGLFFGMGAASKWTCIYAGAGLAVIFFIDLFLRGRDAVEEHGFGKFVLYVLRLGFVCVGFFIVIPIAVYCLSYYPYGLSRGMTFPEMLTNPDYYKVIWNNQVFMYEYHSQLKATHSYSSVWYEWIFNARPILYYRRFLGGGMRSLFAAFGNPIVWWGGLVSVILMGYRTLERHSTRSLFILLAYLSQLVPWLFVSRCVFIYHYFNCVPFLAFATADVFNTIWERKIGRYKLAVIGYTAVAVILFALFYPVMSGIPVSDYYTTYVLRWFPGWPF